MNPLPTPDQLEHFAGRQKARRRAELLALEMAQAADAAARLAMAEAPMADGAAAARHASEAWAGLAVMLKPNGAVD